MFKQFFSRSGLAKMAGVGVAAGLITAAFHTTAPVKASDHDDGETNIKSRNLNLTDLYVFREDWQTDNDADASNLIFVMNTNPRSLPRQQYFFNTLASYNFHVGRQNNRNNVATGQQDVVFSFRFGTPDNNSRQQIFLDVVRFANGQEASRETLNGGFTTPAPVGLGPNPAQVNPVPTAAGTLTVFAGLREDPFFFDVDAFFRTRAAAVGAASPAGTQRHLPGNPNQGALPGAAGNNPTDATNAIDFAKGYNVNAIVMRVPISLLQAGGNNETTFDVWETITVPSVLGGVL